MDSRPSRKTPVELGLPRYSDLRDALCFVHRHEHLAGRPDCSASMGEAHRLIEAMRARIEYQSRAAPSEEQRIARAALGEEPHDQ